MDRLKKFEIEFGPTYREPETITVFPDYFEDPEMGYDEIEQRAISRLAVGHKLKLPGCDLTIKRVE